MHDEPHACPADPLPFEVKMLSEISLLTGKSWLGILFCSIENYVKDSNIWMGGRNPAGKTCLQFMTSRPTRVSRQISIYHV